MKKLFLGMTALVMLASCKNDPETEMPANSQNQTTLNASTDATARLCPSEEIRQNLLQTDASALRRYNSIEAMSAILKSKPVRVDNLEAWRFFRMVLWKYL